MHVLARFDMDATHRNTPDAQPRQVRVLDAPRPRSVILSGVGADRPAELDPEHEYTIGRDPQSADFVLDHRDVSRVHGRLYFDKATGVWVYRDLNSTNGSFIGKNRERVIEAPLESGDVVFLGGGAAQLRFSPNSTAKQGAVKGFSSKAWATLQRELELIVRSPERVMIYGPRGSGKTTLAHEIHDRSKKNALETQVTGELISMNCGNLSSDEKYLASEFFGHVKGAFTDARDSRTGKLQAAKGGTLLLDEVESLNPQAAAFLISILDGRANAAPLGSDRVEPLPRFRVIGTTKKALSELNLRSDLFDRFLMGHIVTMPSLADRREDLLPLAEELLEREASARAIKATLSEAAQRAIVAHDWPGETRELEAVIRMAFRRCLLQASGDVAVDGEAVSTEIEKRKLMLGRREEPEVGPPKLRASELTKEHVVEALEKTGGKILPAAKLLGISRTTIKEKMKDFGIPRPLRQDLGD
ncbi:MAG: sigma 54-interacting transcriptional regulator [Myxococcota bacterium]